MTDNYDSFGGSGIFFAFLIFALFAFGGNGGGLGLGRPWRYPEWCWRSDCR